VLQAHAIQVQILQNELESLRAQLINLKGKSSQRASHAQPVEGLGSWRDLLGHSMVSHTMPWLGSMLFPVHTILISHQNLSLLYALPTLWHKRLMCHLEFLPLGR